MKFLPNTSSSGGRSFLGVVVWIMDRDSGLIPGSLAISASLDCMLYNLGYCVRRSGRLRENSALEFNKQVWAVLKMLRRAMEEANWYRPGSSSLRQAPLSSEGVQPVYCRLKERR